MKENKGGGEEASLRWAWANVSLTLFHSLCAHGHDALHTSIFITPLFLTVLGPQQKWTGGIDIPSHIDR